MVLGRIGPCTVVQQEMKKGDKINALKRLLTHSGGHDDDPK